MAQAQAQAQPQERQEQARWSHSRLTLYTRCPAAWAMKYRDGLPEQVSPAAVRGQQLHEFAEAYGRWCMDTGQERDYSWAREQAASYSEEVRELCVAFSNQVSFKPGLIYRDGPPVEREFAVPLPDDLGTLRGRVDLVQWDATDRALLLTDYKSGWGTVEPPERTPTQLLCYAWALVQADFPEAEAVSVANHYVGNGQVHEWELWAPDLRPDWAVSVVRRILADHEFGATPSPTACGWCGYTQHCPLVQADPALHPRDEEEARATCRQAWATGARLDALKGALKEFTADQPLTYAGKAVAGRFPAKDAGKRKAILAEDATVELLVDALYQAGLTPDDFLTPKEDKLGALLHDEFGAMEDDPNPFGEEEEDAPELAAVRALLKDKPASGRLTFRLDDPPQTTETTDEEGEEHAAV